MIKTIHISGMSVSCPGKRDACLDILAIWIWCHGLARRHGIIASGYHRRFMPAQQRHLAPSAIAAESKFEVQRTIFLMQ